MLHRPARSSRRMASRSAAQHRLEFCLHQSRVFLASRWNFCRIRQDVRGERNRARHRVFVKLDAALVAIEVVLEQGCDADIQLQPADRLRVFAGSRRRDEIRTGFLPVSSAPTSSTCRKESRRRLSRTGEYAGRKTLPARLLADPWITKVNGCFFCDLANGIQRHGQIREVVGSAGPSLRGSRRFAPAVRFHSSGSTQLGMTMTLEFHFRR